MSVKESFLLTIKGYYLPFTKNSLIRNALALATNTLSVSVLGYFFWWLVARFLSEDKLGFASSIISAATLIASLTTMGLGFGIIRWYPNAINKSGLINASLTWSSLAAILLTGIFITSVPLWSPEFTSLQKNIELLLLFLFLPLLINLAQMLEQIFIAVRHSEWTALMNGLSVIIRVSILTVFGLVAWRNTQYPILAFELSLLFSVTISLVWLLPSSLGKKYTPYLTVRGLSNSFIRYALINHLANIFQQLPILLLPILVINVLGAKQTAYFYIPWTIANGLAAVAASGALSLFAEGANTPDQLTHLTRQAIGYGILFSTAITGGLILFARFLLSIFGASYAKESTSLLTILAFTILPIVINTTLFSVLRVQKRLGLLICGQAAIMFLSIGLSYLFINHYGLTGLGMAWLIAQVGVLIVGGLASALLIGPYAS